MKRILIHTDNRVSIAKLIDGVIHYMITDKPGAGSYSPVLSNDSWALAEIIMTRDPKNRKKFKFKKVFGPLHHE